MQSDTNESVARLSNILYTNPMHTRPDTGELKMSGGIALQADGTALRTLRYLGTRTTSPQLSNRRDDGEGSAVKGSAPPSRNIVAMVWKTI